MGKSSAEVITTPSSGVSGKGFPTWIFTPASTLVLPNQASEEPSALETMS